MSARTGHTIRWAVVWGAVALWFLFIAFDVAGDAAHLLLGVAVAVLVYELLVEAPPPA
ncbi:MAG TPA: hypothetical protein VFM93_05155 [Candidatus Limnocylindria bacterium]|nr:hypothetical protein [Candidatus Limnocylindria bacterium]